ncbi:hypothetical protein OIO90_000095 [Microbotryomycetes sp. JL221]|nr:hypothetical protein OIO90_000095 [Microbotryomycetes sp. JL221]
MSSTSRLYLASEANPASSASSSSSAPSATSSPASTSTSASSNSPLPAAFRAPTLPRTPAVNPFVGAGSSYARTKSYYKLHVSSTRNNTILTLTHTPGADSFDTSSDDPHHVVAWVSGGSAGFKGASRATYDAAVEASLRMFKKIKNLVDPPIGPGGQIPKVLWARPTEIEIVWKGFGQGRDAVYRTLMGGEGDAVRGLVKRVTDATPLKIGGTRPKKKRTI